MYATSGRSAAVKMMMTRVNKKLAKAVHLDRDRRAKQESLINKAKQIVTLHPHLTEIKVKSMVYFIEELGYQETGALAQKNLSYYLFCGACQRAIALKKAAVPKEVIDGSVDTNFVS